MPAIQMRIPAVTSADDMCAGYRAARKRLWGVPPKPEPAPVAVIEAPPIVPLPPKRAEQTWKADLFAFNELVRSLFAIGKERRIRRVERMVDIVAAHYDLTVEELIGGPRTHAHARRRQVAMYICLAHFGMTTIAVGAFFNRDHTTVMYARKIVIERMGCNPVFAIEVHNLVTACA